MRRWEQGESVLMDEINAPGATRNDVAMVYAACIRYDAPVNWAMVNAHIVNTWSTSGLAWIKRCAWKALAAPLASSPAGGDPGTGETPR